MVGTKPESAAALLSNSFAQPQIDCLSAQGCALVLLHRLAMATPVETHMDWLHRSLSLNKPKLDNLAGDIWKSAERLRGKFKAYEYQRPASS
jgi:hypothetical protein